MKKSQLQQIIKEELQSVLKEYTQNNFSVDAQTSGYGNPINPSILSKLLPKSAQTTKEAEERLRSFEGGQMFVHSQVFYGKPNGNRPDRPLIYFGQSQYYLRNKDVNVTKLLIEDATEAGLDAYKSGTGKGKRLGWAFVSTDVFLNEFKVMYELADKVTENRINEAVSNEQMEDIVAGIFNDMGLTPAGVDANVTSGISTPSVIVLFKKMFDTANKMRIVDDYNDMRDMSTPEMIGADVLGSNKVRFYFKPNK